MDAGTWLTWFTLVPVSPNVSIIVKFVFAVNVR